MLLFTLIGLQCRHFTVYIDWKVMEKLIKPLPVLFES